MNVDDLETEINRLVYELYGLTEEEVAIVEGKEPTPNPSQHPKGAPKRRREGK